MLGMGCDHCPHFTCPNSLAMTRVGDCDECEEGGNLPITSFAFSFPRSFHLEFLFSFSFFYPILPVPVLNSCSRSPPLAPPHRPLSYYFIWVFSFLNLTLTY